jgi:hypothetical protein
MVYDLCYTPVRNCKFTEKSGICSTDISTLPISCTAKSITLLTNSKSDFVCVCVLSFLQCTKRVVKETLLRRHLYEAPCFTLKPNLLYHINNGTSLDALLSQINPARTSPHTFFNIHLNIILPTSKGYKWSSHFKSSNQRVCILV